MIRWLLGRLGRAVITLLLLIAFTFFALKISADPALQILGPDAGKEAVEAFRQKWGLNEPLWRQFLTYLAHVLQLDLGMSYRTNASALQLVLSRVPATLALMIPTALVALAIGVPMGILAAYKRSTGWDRCITLIAIVGFAIPNFLIGILLIYLFSVKLGWLPPSGIVDWRSFLMPMFTMAIAEAAIFARFTRSAMIEVLEHPMIETALASGFTRGKVLLVHVLPNAGLPLLTIAGLFVGSLIGGGVVTENVFSWPGTGRLLVESVGARDFTVVQCTVLLIGATMIVANLLVDVCYLWVDPRLRDAKWRSKS
ncbi:ABC transporter permease [Phyllobacterium phragmitis]|uniref:ABC transporter permease n=1 Tax=Phyllobacterium phragmitis TaxID=2670329 RepID=A0A2S9IQX6_9HYPH|nr:ABC transporter permease [Phyllobacterium phragmitis]PRD42919.1 ABC transporter permease [Phyllobacterium phragmitis]